MKKKILSLTLAALMMASLLCFSSCAKPETAYTLISGAVKKTEALNDLDMTMEMNMAMQVMGLDVTVPMTYDIKATGLKSDAPVYRMDMTMSVLGMEMSVDAYVEGNDCYVSTREVLSDEPVNVKMTLDQFAADNETIDSVQSMVQPLSEEQLADKEIVVNEDGSKTVSVEMDEETFNRIFDTFVDSAVAAAAEDAEGMQLSMSNIKLDMTVGPDGYFDSYRIAFDMTMTMEEAGISMDMECHVDAMATYNNPGEKVTVTPMEGYEDFEEFEE